MKKTLIPFILGLFLAGPWISEGAAQTTEEVLEKMIEAQGGRELLKSIQDSTLTGSMEMIQMGLNGAITLYQKEPNKMRMDMELMGMRITQAFDGEKAWMINPQTGMSEELPDRAAEELKRQSLGTDSFLHPEKYGISYSFIGKETVDNKDCLVLEQTHPDGFKATLYVDPETYLTYKTKAMTINQTGVEVEAETFMSDYRKVEGIMMAHSLMIYQDGSEYITMTISSIQFNSGLEDSFFQMNQ